MASSSYPQPEGRTRRRAAIQRRSPQLRPIVDIDELGGDDEGASPLDDVAREHRLNAELPADVPRIDVLSLVTEDGAARHDAQSRNLREVVDEALGETIAEVIELCVAAAIHQRKHSQRLDHVARATAAPLVFRAALVAKRCAS